ncbi:MAG: type II toxin-antitoxin system CcdA family antitoxin [Thiotrichales bacterium]
MNTTDRSRPKRPVNLLLSEVTVRQARAYTDNLSATVDALLADYFVHSQKTEQSQQQRADAVAEAWNQFQAAHGSFADDYSPL